MGELDGIAPGESIFSARFAGNRAYLVTFEKVDPFFVIDLAVPGDPKILGELKIPGYSNYLHPFNETLVIGVGKDAVDVGDFSWYQGVKVSLFDVSDVENPSEVSSHVMGDRGTESLALTDSHAFLADFEKGIVAMPVDVYERPQSATTNQTPPNTYGEYVWSGVCVFGYTEDTGLTIKGTVIHHEQSGSDEYGYYYGHQVKRTFYAGNGFFSVSSHLIIINSLDDLTELKRVNLP